MVAQLNRLGRVPAGDVPLRRRPDADCQDQGGAVGNPRSALLLLRCANCRTGARTGGPLCPWSRYPDDTLDNFVVADKSCNGFKSSSLAAADHLTRWTRRFGRARASTPSCLISRQATWDRQPDRSLNVARAIYLRLPDDARLWLRGKEFVPPGRDDDRNGAHGNRRVAPTARQCQSIRPGPGVASGTALAAGAVLPSWRGVPCRSGIARSCLRLRLLSCCPRSCSASSSRDRASASCQISTAD